jgi:hypothetical protein
MDLSTRREKPGTRQIGIYDVGGFGVLNCER